MVPHAHISIHAPLTGRDQRQREEAGGADGISIHAPRTGHDACVFPFATSTPAFQSTCPVRGTTRRSDAAHAVRHFNPRAPYGARHRKEVDGELPRHISIHVPRTGHDGEGLEEVVSDVLISIHVPRTGHDREDMIHEDVAYCISIHVPRTGHDAALKQAQVRAEISIHVPRTGHDFAGAVFCYAYYKFQSTCPVRGTTAVRRRCYVQRRRFQSTCPVRGTTRWRRLWAK